MFDITAVGELLVDFTECGTSPAGMRLFEQNAGGAVTNLLAAAARCGANTAFIGKVGDDMHGRFLKRAMERAGVHMEHLLVSPEAFTTLAFVALSQNGERTFSFARKPGADTCLQESELPRDVLAHTRILHTGSLSLTDEPARTATYRAVELAKAAGAIITYDPNYRASLWQSEQQAVAAMRSLIPTAQMMKLSDEETALLTDCDDPAEASARLLAAGVSVVAVTLGERGAFLRVAEGARHVAAFPCEAVDATGAGDAFFGGFLYRFLQLGKRPEALTLDEACDCARFGNAVASVCVERRGGIPAMPTRTEVEKRLAQA